MKRYALYLTAAVLVVAWAWAFPSWPDGWDGLGFLASVHHFDLASFAPHPPGYPVYVALLKLVALFGVSPLGAARVVAVGSGLFTFAALASTLEAARAPRADALFGAAAICLTPLVFQTFSSVGSEGPALLFASLAALGALDRDRSPLARSVLVGLGVGLGLGVRLSWAPFYLPFLVLIPKGARIRALLLAGVVCVAWAVPLVVLTGAPELMALARTHLAGHMTVWGGTAVTEPTRLPYLLRDVFVDGFGCEESVLGIVTGVLLVGCVVACRLGEGKHTPHVLTPRGEGYRVRTVSFAVFLVPYLAWVTFGQNLKEQPRHVVPLVAVLAFGLVRGVLLSAPPRRVLLGAAGLLVALLASRSGLEAQRRLSIPPAGIQLLAYLRAHATDAPPSSTAVFAGESGRFLDDTEWQAAVHPAATTGDALLALSRLRAIPTHVFLTGELKDLPPTPPIASFCGPPRIASRMPCLSLYAADEMGLPTR